MAKLTFLGTGGGRYCMASQARATAGFRLEMDNISFHIDPGPGALIRAKELGANIKDTDVILLSHVHLDHSNDCNALIDAMTEGAKNQRGILVGSVSAIKGHEGNSPAVMKIFLKALENVITMKAGDSTTLKSVTISATPTKHSDPTCIGFRIEGSKTVAYVSDTEYFPGLEKYHKNADVMIINTLRPANDEWPMHMSMSGAAKLIKAAGPKLCILQHFGVKAIDAGPAKQARIVSKETGINVIAAEDGMEINLERTGSPLSKYIRK